jgi:hypothetical protein
MPITAKSNLIWISLDGLEEEACWISNFISSDGTYVPSCPGEQAGFCEECGFGMGPEMSLLLFPLGHTTIISYD